MKYQSMIHYFLIHGDIVYSTVSASDIEVNEVDVLGRGAGGYPGHVWELPICKRLNPEMSFAQDHSEHTRKGGSP